MTLDKDLANVAQALKRGALHEALTIAERVVASAPNNARALALKGEAQLYLGQAENAARTLAQAQRLDTGNVELLVQLGLALQNAGRPHEAVAALEDALKLDSAHGLARLNLGAALAASGQLDRAVQALMPGVENPAIAPRAAAGLAHILEQLQQWAPAEKYARIWTGLEPANEHAWRALSRALWEMGDVRRALESYRAFLKFGGRNPAALVSFARICLSARQLEDAEAALTEAQAMTPTNADMLSAFALLRVFQGKLDEAEASARRSLAANPADASAFRVLSEVSEGKLSGADVALLETAAKRTDLIANDAASLQFSLGDYYDAAGLFDKAFASYSNANQIMLANASRATLYDREVQSRFVTSLIAARGETRPAHATQFSPDVTPVFIVGMPRSGTTLIESVLAAHPAVEAFGEREAMRRIAAERYARGPQAPPTPAELELWARRYLEETRSSPAKVIVDKNPWNYDCVDLIFDIFPNAKVIHIRRDAVETGFSIFKNQFSGFMTFTNDLSAIGHYYKQYARLISHWEALYGDRILSLQYETFVDDFEKSARALIGYCGLDWNDNSLKFWKTPRTISTMTAVSARKPVVGQRRRADHYIAHLEPLISQLRAEGVDLRTGKLGLGEQRP
ncbi:MAG: sulfotransferase [Hyphomonadaceae bacterium]|nr:sulfotransferase [Hyphomonadaceae bacterium]